MEFKSASLMFACLLSVVILLGFTSTATFSPDKPTLTFSPTSLSQSFTITQANSSALQHFELVNPVLSGDSYTFTFSPSEISSTVDANNKTTYTLNAASIDLSKFSFGKTYTSSFVLRDTANNSDSDTINLQFSNQNFCDYNNLGGHLDVSIDGVSNKGIGDDYTWYPADDVQIDLSVSNNGPERISSIKVEWGLWSTSKNGWIGKKYSESTFSLGDGDDKSLTLNYKLDKSLSSLDSGDFTLYVKVTGKDSAYESNYSCNSVTQSIDIPIENFVKLDNFVIPASVSCGSDMEITADAFNIGGDTEDNVYVVVKNSELGFDKRFNIGDIDSLDSQSVDIVLPIPQNATPKLYSLDFYVYDGSNDIYEANDIQSKFSEFIKVDGVCGPLTSAAVSGGDIQSGGKSGEDLVVKTTITNTGKDIATFTFNPSGFDSWAESANLDSTTAVLGVGQSKDVLITFKTKDISGAQSFNLDVLSNGKVVKTQPFSVTLEKPTSWLSSLNLKGVFGDNWYLWIIGALNVILVLIIIVVAVRVARK